MKTNTLCNLVKGISLIAAAVTSQLATAQERLADMDRDATEITALVTRLGTLVDKHQPTLRNGKKELVWLDGATQFDFYDNEDMVSKASNAVSNWFARN
jgi:hypothetical protein